MDIRPLRTAGILLGIGMGGFVDGILFHQIFQFHNMLSNRYFPDTLVNEQINMFWDGIFHAFTWTATALGLAFFYRVAEARRVPLDRNVFLGSMLLGWGAFNLVEGIIDHHLLGLHHVVQRATGTTRLLFDLAFLFSGIVLIGVGEWMIRRGKRNLAAREGTLRLAS